MFLTTLYECPYIQLFLLSSLNICVNQLIDSNDNFWLELKLFFELQLYATQLKKISQGRFHAVHSGIPECQLSVEDILKLITGCQQKPALGFQTPIMLSFVFECPENCKCRPSASTCDLHLHLPHHINSLESMTKAGISMLKECFGFGIV